MSHDLFQHVKPVKSSDKPGSKKKKHFVILYTSQTLISKHKVYFFRPVPLNTVFKMFRQSQLFKKLNEEYLFLFYGHIKYWW